MKPSFTSPALSSPSDTYETASSPFAFSTNLHSFNDGLLINRNATLTGNGTIAGAVTLATGSALAPGTSIGKIQFTDPPVLHGTVVMEIRKQGGFGRFLTNDQIQVNGTLNYFGSLIVTNIGSVPLAGGNSFKLFDAPAYTGSFTNIIVPALGPGLSWNNRLHIDGSIAVVGPYTPSIVNLTSAGTDLVLDVADGQPASSWKLLTATNVALPLSSWATNSSGFFDVMGGVTITNVINLTEPQRYYRIKSP